MGGQQIVALIPRDGIFTEQFMGGLLGPFGVQPMSTDDKWTIAS